MSFAKLLILCVTFICAGGLNLETLDCVIPFGSPQQWSTFWPVVFNQQGQLLKTMLLNDIESVVIPSNTNVIVSCGPNYLKKQFKTEFVNVQCRGDGQFELKNGFEVKTAKDLGCDLRSVQEILTEVKGCPRDKTAVKFGLVNPVDHKAYIIGEACYCETAGKLLFAHIRRGDLLSYSLEIKDKDIFKAPAPSSTYKVDFMKAFRLDEFNNRLKTALKVEQVPLFDMRNFVDDLFLPNRQLYSIKKLAWNYFVSHEPLLNYQLLKQDIADLEGNIDIYTGAYGVTTLKNKSGGKVPIYLDLEEKRFPVPELIWIVVRHEKGEAAFMVFNDPSLNSELIEDKLSIRSKCNYMSWLKRLKEHNKHSIGRNGFVVCCDVKELAEEIPEFPLHIYMSSKNID